MNDISNAETKGLEARIKELESKLAKAEAVGRECENRYRSILNLSLDSIIIVNYEGVLIDVNKQFCDWTGYSKEELLASPAMRPLFLSPEVRKKVVSVIKKRLPGQEVLPYELPIITKSGDTVVGEVHAAILYDSLGVAEADMVVLRDVTARKKRGGSSEGK